MEFELEVIAQFHYLVALYTKEFGLEYHRTPNRNKLEKKKREKQRNKSNPVRKNQTGSKEILDSHARIRS